MNSLGSGNPKIRKLKNSKTPKIENPLIEEKTQKLDNPLIKKPQLRKFFRVYKKVLGAKKF